MDDRRAAPVSRHEGYGGRQVASGARSSHGDSGRVHPDGRGVLRYPFGRGIAVLDRRRELVLGGQAVVDGHDGTSRSGDDVAHGPVVGLDVANDPAAAVEIDEDGKRGVPVGPVNTDRDVAFGARDRAVLKARDVGTRRPGCRVEVGPGLFGGLLLQRWPAQGPRRIFQRLGLRV